MQSLKCQIEGGETFYDLLLALLLIQPHILWLSSLLRARVQMLSSFSVNLHPVSSQPALEHGGLLSWHGTGYFPLLNSTSFLQTRIYSLSMSLWWTAALPYQSGRTRLQTCKLCSPQTCWEYTPCSPCLFVKIPNIMDYITKVHYQDCIIKII